MGRLKKANFGSLGPQGRAVIGWLENLEPLALTDNLPMCMELATLADGLAAIRENLVDPDLKILDQTRLRSQECRLSEAFRKAWVTLGLAIDRNQPPATMGRPVAGDRA